MDFGVSLQRERKQIGLSVEDVSKRCGISTATLVKFENGSAIPTLEVFVKLCQVLEKNPNEMLDGVTFPHCRNTCDDKSNIHPRIQSLTRDEKIQYAISLKKQGKSLCTAYLQRKLSIGYEEAKTLLQVVNSCE